MSTHTSFPPDHWHYKRVHANNVQFGVAYPDRLYNNQPVLVLLHGFTGSAASWDTYLDRLASTGIAAIALDMLGHGLSDTPADPQRYQMERCREDIPVVLQTLGIKRDQAILLGYSMGGRIALYCAFSGYFRAVILESASPGLATEVERQQRRNSDEALARSIESEGITRFVDFWEQLPLFATQHSLTPDVLAMQRIQRIQNNPQGLANSLRGVGTGMQPALHQHLPKLNIPVLLLAGALDQKFCAIAQQMVQQLPQAQLSIIPEAGHAIHLEQPEAFVEQVHKFCTSVLS